MRVAISRKLLAVGGLAIAGLLAGAITMTDLAGEAGAQDAVKKPVEKPAPPQAQAPTAPSGPKRTENIVYDNWIVNCRDAAARSGDRNGDRSGNRVCSATLRVVNDQNRQAVLIWEIGNDATGKPVFALRTPLGVLMRPGVVVTIGQGKPRKVDFALCDTHGCEAAAPFDPVLAKEMTAASEANVVFTAINGQAVSISFPLKGIGPALAEIGS